MKTLRHDDLPSLRNCRDALRELIARANAMKAKENDLGMLVAYASVLDTLQGQFDRVGRQMAKLESSPVARH